MSADYYDIIKLISQATMRYVAIYMMQKKEGPKYTSWRKGFYAGALWAWIYIIIGAIIIGIPLIQRAS